jgi:apolipoprotein N-acyltransferase
VWPEDVVDVDRLEGSREDRELAALAERLGATLIVGIVEDAGPDHFRNASVAYDPDGEVVDRYDKVHRVPFGEYVPLKWLVERFGGEDLTSRDAIIGDEPALLDTPAGRFSVVISWEVFFGDRAREGVAEGAEVVLNPTNGSSFTGTMVQTQQVASSRMRAIESDRWMAQVSPTGFTAVIDPDGTVLQRTAVSEQAVVHATLGRREGTTPYTRLGLAPALAVAFASLALGWLVARSRRVEPVPGAAGTGGGDPEPDRAATAPAAVDPRGGEPGGSDLDPAEPGGSDLDDDGDRPVVDEGDAHVGPEPAGRNLGAERP